MLREGSKLRYVSSWATKVSHSASLAAMERNSFSEDLLCRIKRYLESRLLFYLFSSQKDSHLLFGIPPICCTRKES